MADRARARSAPGDDATFDANAADAAVEAALEAAVASAPYGAVAPSPALVEALARLPGPGGARADPVDAALARALVAAVAGAWRQGWQPADVHRVVDRRHGRAHARLVVRAIGREALRHAEAGIPPRWRLQLDAIGADVSRSGGTAEPWVVPWPPAPSAGGGSSVERLQAVEVAVVVLALVRGLPRLPRLGPIPGEAGAGPARAAGPRSRAGGRAARGTPHADPRVLHKVTALLAKAESTNFPDEAEALTAKAQELMTRHAIDRAHVAATTGGGDPQIGGRRVGIDDPYAGARYLLLSSVADANRCRAVWTRQWGFSTVFGDEGDLDAVELLYTSLLVQATRAMVAQPRSRGTGAGDTRSFRQSFLVAFAGRIGERLARAADAVTADEASRSTALVPLFEARRTAAQAALDEAFPHIRTTRMSARSPEGWQAGVRAADRAELDAHRRVRPSTVPALR
jgi:hypothetical protein